MFHISHQPKHKPKIAKEYVFANDENQTERKKPVGKPYIKNSGFSDKTK